MEIDSIHGAWWMLAFFVSLCFLAGALGSRLAAGGQTAWYPRLRKPPETPPDWVFAPVWSSLYLAMALAAWLVWLEGGWEGAQHALVLFFVQLGLNVLWTGLFFGLRRPGLAFYEVVALWLAILWTMIAFEPWSAAAAWLMTPYLLWVSFAAWLNLRLWRLNR